MEKRKSNIELLRIILILLVIILHYMNISMGGALGKVRPNTFDYYLDHFIESLSIVAVNVFILITGYFLFEIYTFPQTGNNLELAIHHKSKAIFVIMQVS